MGKEKKLREFNFRNLFGLEFQGLMSKDEQEVTLTRKCECVEGGHSVTVCIHRLNRYLKGRDPIVVCFAGTSVSRAERGFIHTGSCMVKNGVNNA